MCSCTMAQANFVGGSGPEAWRFGESCTVGVERALYWDLDILVMEWMQGSFDAGGLSPFPLDLTSSYHPVDGRGWARLPGGYNEFSCFLRSGTGTKCYMYVICLCIGPLKEDHTFPH